MAFLGIDVGTGGTRALVIDGQGNVVAFGIGGASTLCEPEAGLGGTGSAGTGGKRGGGGGAQRVCKRQVCAPEEIACVGFSGQMHGAVFARCFE